MKKAQSVRNAKIIQGIVTGIAISCICICAGGMVGLRAGFNTVDNPEEARKIAQSIVEYNLPIGYSEKIANFLFFSKIIVINPTQRGNTNQPVLSFTQFPEELKMDDEDIRFKLKQGMTNYKNVNFVETKEIIIRGQETSLAIYEGADNEGTQVRQVISGAVKAKEGFIILIITGPIQNWDQEMIDKFIKSIR